MSSLIRKFCYNKYISTAQLLAKFYSSSSSGDGRPSEYPPKPIANRPMRKQSTVENQQIMRFKQNGENEGLSSSRSSGDDDFLERFKLGSDRKMDSLKPDFTKMSSKSSDTEEIVSPSLPLDADVIFEKMKQTGLIPNAVAMLDGLCKDGLVQEAMKLFGYMREKGTIPGVVVYTAVVEGFFKAHKFDDAMRIFKRMRKNGIVPNAFSYGLLIGGLCKAKMLEEGYEFCIEMLEAGHSPNLPTFISLVDGYCQEKGLEEAQTIISSMRQKGFFVEEKAVTEYLDKKGPFSPLVWEAVVGKKAPKMSLF